MKAYYKEKLRLLKDFGIPVTERKTETLHKRNPDGQYLP